MIYSGFALVKIFVVDGMERRMDIKRALWNVECGSEEKEISRIKF